uniref:Uncharacterized protein n=1 Tax=virus sp. ctE0n6 TaxID=2827985 RepID=A0A8S5RFZ8_9VIRU|nr:MAG TPA: hypothetical protein [virus sp. ctE0n6]
MYYSITIILLLYYHYIIDILIFNQYNIGYTSI